jgi:hypothetical protein
MRSGWEQAGADPQHWYRRDIVAGPLSFCIDLWAIDDDNREWAFCFNNGFRDRFVAQSADNAMANAEAELAGYLRAAAKICRNVDKQ